AQAVFSMPSMFKFTLQKEFDDFPRHARQALYRKSRINRHDKTAGESHCLSKSRDFWFALISVVRPDAIEFLFLNSAVLCGLQFAVNLSQQFSHLVPPQRIPKDMYIPKSVA